MNTDLEQNEASALLLTYEARTASVKRGVENFLAGKNALHSGCVSAFNYLRAAGQDFHVASGRQQLAFTATGVEFFNESILPSLPPDMGLREVQMCCHLATNVTKPVENIEELRQWMESLQGTFKLFGLIPATARGAIQTAHQVDLFSRTLRAAAAFWPVWSRLISEAPPEQWAPAHQDDFLEAAEPVHRAYETIKKLRLGNL